MALEFTWPNGKKSETWGIRVEFASAAETHGKITPFFIPESLARGDFLDAEKCPLDYTAFKAFAEGREGRIYPEGIEAYLRDMAQPVHLNFDKNVLCALLPTAMSFNCASQDATGRLEQHYSPLPFLLGQCSLSRE